MVGARHRRAATVLAGLLVASSLTVAGATATEDDELDTVHGRLGVASRELDEVEAQVRRAGAAVSTIDERLRGATTRLHEVGRDLVDAEAAAVTASEAERRAAARLADVGQQLATLRTSHRQGRDQLHAQAVATFKRGHPPTTELAFSGVVRADDWHEVAVTRDVLEQLLVAQRTAVDTDAARTRRTARGNAEVGDARREAVAASREAETERARVDRLVADQQRLVAGVEAELAQRAAVLARLEADATARAVLVTELERRAEELHRAAAVLVPVVAVPDDGPPPDWARALPPAGRRWAASVDAAAQRQGVDGRLLAALVWTESNFRPDAVSHAGAIGLAQLMPGTARGLGVDPWDPAANLAGGARYLRAQLDTFGRVDLALAAYNAGPGRVSRDGGVPHIVETQLYVVRVLERHQQLISGRSG